MRKDRPEHKPHRKRRHRRGPLGAVPGTLLVDPEAPRPIIRTLAYDPTELREKEITDIRSLGDFLHKWPVLWVNVDGLGDANIISQLGEIFGLHRLALEDVINVHQRPKVEQYDRYLFLVAHMLFLSESLETEQVSFFVGKGFVLTFQEQVRDCFDPVRDRIRKGLERIRGAPADYLVYALLDAILDSYFPILERYGERLEALEEEIITNPDEKTISRIHQNKRDLLALRRALWPLRDAINSLLRDATAFFAAETRIYLRDCYDHTIQIIDMLESYRETASSLLDIHLSSISNRMNEVMKVLTIIATIFMPLTFLAGIYGMNFNPEKSPWNMPELNWRWGYPFALGLMFAIFAGLAAYFRRKRWL